MDWKIRSTYEVQRNSGVQYTSLMLMWAHRVEIIVASKYVVFENRVPCRCRFVWCASAAGSFFPMSLRIVVVDINIIIITFIHYVIVIYSSCVSQLGAMEIDGNAFSHLNFITWHFILKICRFSHQCICQQHSRSDNYFRIHRNVLPHIAFNANGHNYLNA